MPCCNLFAALLCSGYCEHHDALPLLAYQPLAGSPAYYNEDFLREYEYRGSPVTVVGGQVIKVDLTPIHVRLP